MIFHFLTKLENQLSDCSLSSTLPSYCCYACQAVCSRTLRLLRWQQRTYDDRSKFRSISLICHCVDVHWALCDYSLAHENQCYILLMLFIFGGIEQTPFPTNLQMCFSVNWDRDYDLLYISRLHSWFLDQVALTLLLNMHLTAASMI